jgi:hypothetical protein
MRRLGLLLLLLTAVLPARGEPDGGDEAGVPAFFRRGRTELTLGAGYGTFDDNGYMVLLLGGGYYLRDGLSVGATGEAWTGARPQIYNVSPQVRLVLLDAPRRYKPYLGAFYRRTAYSRRLAPLNSAGARAGLVFPFGARTYLTAGLVYESDFACDKSVYSRCDGAYPEAGLTFSF